MRFSKITYLSLVGLAIFIAGCSSSQLAQVPQTRENYNKAIDASENEQFLLNIVRMHDGRSPYFVGVDSITVQSSLKTKSEFRMFNVNGFPAQGVAGPFWSVGPTIELTEAPTITYSPLQGSKFVASMMTPLTISRISMLRSSGWALPNLLKLCINRVGVLDNSNVSSHVMGDDSHEDGDFNHFINEITELSSLDKLDGSMTSYDGNPAFLLTANDTVTGAKISNLLHLKGVYTTFILAKHLDTGIAVPENVINVQTRSFLGIMNYISYGIHDKESDADNEYASHTGQFYVLTSNSEPSNAAVKTSYNGKWYYVASNDSKSKSTLVLLKLIYSLQVGDIKTNLPVVTIPVR